jgi:hypothetical protein
MLSILHHELTTPNLVQSFWPCRRPEDFAAITSHAGSVRVVEADFEVGGRTYGVYTHDWRERTPAEWVASLARKAAGAPPTPRDVPLDERRLRDAVSDALKAFRSPHDLGRSALLAARFVRASGGEPLELLRATLRGAVTGLGTSARGSKLALAITRTYLDENARASSQEAVAESLGLPFSTYRRHLTAGVEAVADQLWDLERRHYPKLDG